MAWYSKLSSKEFIIDEDNAHTVYVPPQGQSKGLEPRDYSIDPVGLNGLAAPFDDNFLIPRSEWPARIEEMEKTESRLSDFMRRGQVPSLDQNGTNYCWCHGFVTGILALRAANGQPFVDLSPASAAAQIKNFRNSGGWGTQALKFIQEHGVAEAKLWPHNAINRKYLTAEMKANARLYLVPDWYDFPDVSGAKRFDFKMSCLLRRIPVPSGYNWWSHETCGLDPVMVGNNKFGCRERNSWGSSYGDDGFFVLAESKGTPSDACAPKVVSPT